MWPHRAEGDWESENETFVSESVIFWENSFKNHFTNLLPEASPALKQHFA